MGADLLFWPIPTAAATRRTVGQFLRVGWETGNSSKNLSLNTDNKEDENGRQAVVWEGLGDSMRNGTAFCEWCRQDHPKVNQPVLN
jgi:hypothetical protein